MTRHHTGDGFVQFHDGTRIDYAVPTDTRDPRYIACTEHRPACDCREAHLSEDINEYRYDHRQISAAVEEVCAGHPDGCMCTGCQIARRLNITYLIALTRKDHP